MLAIRPYRPEDFPGIERVHDRARRFVLLYAGLEDALLPLRIAAEREDLFAYPGLFVAELGGEIAGFAACTQEELAWLYVDPAHARKGIGRALAEHALQRFPGIRRVEVLSGNAQLAGYFPCILPIPAASMSTPRSAIALHSSGSAHSPIPITPSSSPPIEPTSASIERPRLCATLTSSVVFLIFSSIG